MKSSIKYALSLAGVLAFSSIAMADSKIGVVDIQQILQKSPQVNVISANLKKQFQPREQKIVELEKAHQADIEKLKLDGVKMSDTDRTKLQDKIISEDANLRGLVVTFQRDLGKAQSESIQGLLTQVNTAITQISNDGKYTLIVPRANVISFDKTTDITDQVLQKLNKK